jgi:site-specific DNA-methyltransferase (adenine-specific)
VIAKNWTDHRIREIWVEKIDRDLYPHKLYPHVKPIGLTTRLIGAVTHPGDLIIDPAAGSFVVMQAALALGREFIGCDITINSDIPAQPENPEARAVSLSAITGD